MQPPAPFIPSSLCKLISVLGQARLSEALAASEAATASSAQVQHRVSDLEKQLAAQVGPAVSSEHGALQVMQPWRG
jgi:hypothetical protein